MKILYITPKANDYGGVAKILSIKASELSKKHQVNIITQNDGWQNSPHLFDESIRFHDIKLYGNLFFFFWKYIKSLKEIIKKENPNIIFISDNGLKAYLLPLFINKKIPLVFEVRMSLYNEMKLLSEVVFLSSFFRSLKYTYRKFSSKLYEHIVFLSEESKLEWDGNQKAYIIPNPIVNITPITSNLNQKTAICVARNSYEKGLDRLLEIWKVVKEKNNDWTLKIVGVSKDSQDIFDLIKKLNIDQSVIVIPPTNSVINEFLTASICLMTSRSECFPNVLLEAQSCGIPIVAYDCPVGPRSMIHDSQNGFLIPNGDKQEFATKVQLLIDDIDLRQKMGNVGRENVFNYEKSNVMAKWEKLIQEITASYC
jgi:glycosyltransferase involved in cell wall biosynthesis